MFSRREFHELLIVLWLTLSICLVAVFGWYLAGEVRRRGWRKDPSNKAAIALFFYFLGEAIIRGWSLRFVVMQDSPLSTWEWVIIFVGDALAVTGALCAIRVFSPRHGREVMIGAGAITAASMLCFHFL